MTNTVIHVVARLISILCLTVDVQMNVQDLGMEEQQHVLALALEHLNRLLECAVVVKLSVRIVLNVLLQHVSNVDGMFKQDFNWRILQDLAQYRTVKHIFLVDVQYVILDSGY